MYESTHSSCEQSVESHITLNYVITKYISTLASILYTVMVYEQCTVAQVKFVLLHVCILLNTKVPNIPSIITKGHAHVTCMIHYTARLA